MLDTILKLKRIEEQIMTRYGCGCIVTLVGKTIGVEIYDAETHFSKGYSTYYVDDVFDGDYDKLYEEICAEYDYKCYLIERLEET